MSDHQAEIDELREEHERLRKAARKAMKHLQAAMTLLDRGDFKGGRGRLNGVMNSINACNSDAIRDRARSRALAQKDAQ